MKMKPLETAFFAAIGIMLLGIIVIAGWFSHNDFLLAVVSGGVRMKFNVALCFVLSSFTLLLNYIPVKNKIQHRLAITLPTIVCLIALLTLAEYVGGFNIGIDELFVRDNFSTTDVYYPGRMSPIAAINFLLFGTGLFLLNKEKTSTYQFFYLFSIAFVSLLMIISFNFISDTPTFMRMAVHAAFAFIILSATIYFAQPMLQKNISFERKLFTGFASTIILIIVISIISAFYSNRNVRTFQLIAHTNNILNEAEQTLSVTKDLESGSRGYVITGDSNYLEHFTIARDVVFSHIKNLKELTKDNPVQQIIIDSLSFVIDKRIDFSLQSVMLRNEKGIEAASKFVATRQGKLYMDKIRSLVAKIKNDENNLLVQRQIENDKSISSFNRAFFVFLTCIFILLSVILFSIRSNIAIHKTAEKQKQEIQDFIDSMSTLSAKLSVDGKILMVNKIAQQASGLPMEELLKANFTEGQWWTFDPVVHARVQEAFKKACAGTAINYDEKIFVFGQILFISFSLTPILRQDGSVDYILAEARDISAQKKAEEKIKESEQMFSSLFYKSPIMKAIAETPTGRYIEVNDAFADFFEQSKEEILGKTSVELNMLVHSEERDKILKNLQRDRFARDIETQINSKTGKTRWVSTNIDMINLNGKDCFLTAAIDITERKEAEEKIRQMNMELERRVEEKTHEVIVKEKRFRTMIEKNTDMMTLATPDGKIIYSSPSLTNVLGYSEEELTTIPAFELIHPDDVPGLIEQMQQIIDTPGKSFYRQQRLLHKNRRWIWCEGTVTNLLHDPNIGALVSNFRDMTERKKAEEEIRTLNESLEKKVIDRTTQMEAVNKELEAFSYSVSHDLRAPLRIIDGYTEMLVSDYLNKLDEEGKRMFAIITSNVRKMGQLIDDLLSLSQTGRKELTVHSTDMNGLVKSVIDDQLSLTDKKIDITVEKLLPAKCDSGLLQQVWSNLISNAIKYSGKQEKTVIRISSYRKGPEIIYAIKDNGVGFDMKYSGQLFGVFQRLHKASEFEGTGVGLALVKRIVAKHEGRVWAESETGKGATFFFSLPAGEAALPT
jgi:PAS domain S-box-containing protein